VGVSLTSVLPKHEPAGPALVARVLESLEWTAGDLDASIPPARIYAGNWHLALAARTADRLADLDYDFDGLKAVMSAQGLATLQLVWRERGDLFHSRNPFPVGGVVEDPASGSAAAAFAGYLRDARLVEAPASIVILQGEAMGRPSRIGVEIPRTGGIVVTGHAVALDEEAN
jgi:PhzF family phenazine biosynthesis protein